LRNAKIFAVQPVAGTRARSESARAALREIDAETSGDATKNRLQNYPTATPREANNPLFYSRKADSSGCALGMTTRQSM
jgi:hypothetical protein